MTATIRTTFSLVEVMWYGSKFSLYRCVGVFSPSQCFFFVVFISAFIFLRMRSISLSCLLHFCSCVQTTGSPVWSSPCLNLPFNLEPDWFYSRNNLSSLTEHAVLHSNPSACCVFKEGNSKTIETRSGLLQKQQNTHFIERSSVLQPLWEMETPFPKQFWYRKQWTNLTDQLFPLL